MTQQGKERKKEEKEKGKGPWLQQGKNFLFQGRKQKNGFYQIISEKKID